MFAGKGMSTMLGIENGAGARSGAGVSPEPRAGFDRISLRRLVLIRWIAVAGQAVSLLVVHFLFDFQLPLFPAFAVVFCSVAGTGSSSLATIADGDRDLLVPLHRLLVLSLFDEERRFFNPSRRPVDALGQRFLNQRRISGRVVIDGSIMRERIHDFVQPVRIVSELGIELVEDDLAGPRQRQQLVG